MATKEMISGTACASIAHFVFVFRGATRTICQTIKIPYFTVVIGLYDYSKVINDGMLESLRYRTSEVKTIQQLTVRTTHSRDIFELCEELF